MKTLRFTAALLMVLSTAGLAAQATAPTLSTSDKVALSAIAKDEQQLQTQYQSDEQQKSAIIAEFSNQHPGFHLNPVSFAVEANPKQDAPAKPVDPAKK